MKHLKLYEEIFQSPNLTFDDIQNMVTYLEDFAEKNGYEVYNFPPFNIGKMMPLIPVKRVNKNDPYGEEDWGDEPTEIISNGFKLFDGDNAVLTFQHVRNGNKYFNELWIDNSNFKNITFDMLKKLIED